MSSYLVAIDGVRGELERFRLERRSLVRVIPVGGPRPIVERGEDRRAGP